MIVRDEEESMLASLDAVSAFADEVVVYDTGSTDGTIDVARRWGAVVVEGYWDDDFARARNASLSACRGEWVLAVDADEVAIGGGSGLRSLLRRSGGTDLFLVVWDDHLAARPAVSLIPRLFRRSAYVWAGALHETPVPADRGWSDDLTAQAVPATVLALRHDGGSPSRVGDRRKVGRNLDAARAGATVEDPRLPPGRSQLVLGGALAAAGEGAAAIAAYTAAADASHSGHLTWQEALYRAFFAMLDAQALQADLGGCVRRLADGGADRDLVLYLHAMERIRAGHGMEAKAALETIRVTFTPWGAPLGPFDVSLLLAVAASTPGRMTA